MRTGHVVAGGADAGVVARCAQDHVAVLVGASEGNVRLTHNVAALGAFRGAVLAVRGLTLARLAKAPHLVVERSSAQTAREGLHSSLCVEVEVKGRGKGEKIVAACWLKTTTVWRRRTYFLVSGDVEHLSMPGEEEINTRS